jgi:dienelactone hydrolase
MIFRALLFALALACAPAAHALEGCGHALDRREAAFANGEVALVGEWITPRGMTSAPAVVILQGSGDSHRGNAWSAQIADGLARCGVAVLLTDKRGSGASKGDWRTASMLDLAGDGAAAMAWVAVQPGVDRTRLGFVGLSQGGQVAPAAAEAAPEADFVVGLVTSTGPMKQTLLYELEQTYRQHGLDDAQIAELQAMANASFDWLETGRGWERYLELRGRIAAGPLARGAESWPARQDAPYWTFWRKNGPYDSLPYWRAATGRGCPASWSSAPTTRRTTSTSPRPPNDCARALAAGSMSR